MREPDNAMTQVEELTLLLMYLSSWKENPFARGVPHAKSMRKLTPEQQGFTIRTCWKGYDFNILDALTDEGYVDAKGRTKAAIFTEDGERLAQQLAVKYGVHIDEP